MSLKKVEFIFDYNDNSGRYTQHNGELVYCKTNRLKHFVKNQIYKIKSHYENCTIVLEGIKGKYNFYNFDFIENNPALFRDIRINELMDLDTVTKDPIVGKKIDIFDSKEKEKLLVRMFIAKLHKNIGTPDGLHKNEEIEYDDLIKGIISSYKNYGIDENDFSEIGNLTMNLI